MSDQNALIELARQHGGGPVGGPPPDFTATNVPVDARGVPLDAPRDTRGQIITSTDEAPGTLDKLNAMLGPLAHPQTLTDFARLLTLPVDTVRKAAASALALAASRGPVGDAISATGRGLEKAGTALDKPLSVGGAVEMFRDPVKGTAALVAPAVARGAGRVLQRAGAFVKGAPPAVAVNPAAVPPTLGEAADAPLATPRAPGNTVAPAVTDAEQAVLDRARGNGLPDQKALNEAAIARRRAAYQASQAATTSAPAEAAPAWTPAKLKLTAEETAVAQRLEAAGKTDQQIRDAIEASRELKKRFGSPSSQEAAQELKRRTARTYPKGRMAGGED